MKKFHRYFLGLAVLLLSLPACSQQDSADIAQAGAIGSAAVNPPNPNLHGSPDITRDACGRDLRHGDPLCLGVKYVAYESIAELPALSQEEARTNLASINRLWEKCDIFFHLAEYQSVRPADLGLNESPAESIEMTEIRKVFEDDARLLIVTTEDWNRTGTLGATGANAWTAMPGSFPYGVVLEQSVGTFANIIAHELGHYLGLDHSSDKTSLMSPLIYEDSVSLTAADCASARETIRDYWAQMLD
jgi:hypothetical protein